MGLKQHNDRDLLELQEDCTFESLVRASKTHERKKQCGKQTPPPDSFFNCTGYQSTDFSVQELTALSAIDRSLITHAS